jgi:rhodanese-related sulfurtransferase
MIMNRKKITALLYIITMTGLLGWFAYAKGWILTNFPSIGPQEAITLLQKENNITLLDVRSIDEFKSGHLQGATLIPLAKLKANLDKLSASKENPILVYCRSGMRSVAAARILEANGFKPVNIKGGIIGLKEVKAEIVK